MSVRMMSRDQLVIAAIESNTEFDVARVVHDVLGPVYACDKGKRWYKFQDHRWRKAADGVRPELSTTVHDVVRETYLRGLMTSTDVKRDLKAGHVLCNNLKRTVFKNGVAREAADLFYEEDFSNTLDRSEDLLCFENGVYDLSLGEFRDGRPSDRVSLSTGYDYVDVPDSAPETREIESFFVRVIPNPSVRRYFLTKMAIYLWGKNPEDEFMILTGSGSNGKSKTIELLQHALGEYAVNLPTALMTQTQTRTTATEVARLKGKRLAVMKEPSDGDSLNISILKESSGMMQARPLYGEPFEFKPQFSMIMTCNTLPKVPDTHSGTWRRIKVVEFVSKFTSKPEPDDPTHFPIDRHLDAKFPRWKQTFMCMLLRMFATANARRFMIDVPYEVTFAGEKYLAEQDEMSQWKLECIEKDADAELTIAEALSSFKAWARKDKQRMTPNNFEKKVLSCLGKPKVVGDRKFWPGWRDRIYKIL